MYYCEKGIITKFLNSWRSLQITRTFPLNVFRLIDCNDMSESVENAINKSEYKIQRISSEYGGIEFKLKVQCELQTNLGVYAHCL